MSGKKLLIFFNEEKGCKRIKKVLQPAFVCAQHPKAGQNTQQLSSLITYLFSQRPFHIGLTNNSQGSF